MEHCKECAAIMTATKGNPSQEQLNQLGKPEAENWCKICKQLMMANYQLRHECEQQTLHIYHRHENSAGFTRFDV